MILVGWLQKLRMSTKQDKDTSIDSLSKLEKDYNKGKLTPSDSRKEFRLKILSWTLIGVSIGFASSMSITWHLNINTIASCCNTPVELIVINTVLGSVLTTIVGVIAGTSIN